MHVAMHFINVANAQKYLESSTLTSRFVSEP